MVCDVVFCCNSFEATSWYVVLCSAAVRLRQHHGMWSCVLKQFVSGNIMVCGIVFCSNSFEATSWYVVLCSAAIRLRQHHGMWCCVLLQFV